MRRLFFIFFIAIFLSSCATKPVNTEMAKHTSQDRVIEHDLFIKRHGTGEVIIKRDSGFMGSACTKRVFIDGKPIADLDVAEKIVFYPTIGRHIFSSISNGICGGGLSEVAGDVEENKTIIFRLGTGSNTDDGIYQTAF